MVNTNKVLTVSYGTFSCTLEGFDDSFDMMKAVAEYFRDLASDDRYFGAEPPSLDAETLAHIAARGTRHKISARKEGENVVLAPMPTEDGSVPETTPPTGTSTETAPKVAPATSPVTSPVTSIAERLHRIRSVVDTPVADPYSENEHVEDVAATKSLKEVFDETEENIAPDATAQDPENITVVAPETKKPDEPVKVEPEKGTAQAAPKQPKAAQDDTQVETQVETVAKQEPVKSKEAALEPKPISLRKDKSDTKSGADADNKALKSDQAITDPAVKKAKVAPKEDDLPILDDIEFEDSLAAALGEEKPLTADIEDTKEITTHQTPSVAFDDALASALGEEDNDTKQKSTVKTTVKTNVTEARKPRVHVIKINKTDDSVAVEDATEDKDASDELDAELANILNDTADTNNDGDDTTYVLGPDLAVRDVEPDDGKPEDSKPEDSQDIETDETLAQPITPRRVKAASETTPHRSDSLLRHERQDVSRLMQETDEKLSNPASNRRRSALAHLRAAVAATIADKSIETADRKDDNSDAYREDLATVVRPRRPETRKLRSEIDEPSKTTPLRLVAEQRVDPSEDIKDAPPAKVEPVKVEPVTVEPVKVAHASDEPDPKEFATFEDYSDAIGAFNLEEKLEAAASFLFFVKGMDGFTRPQLMNTVKRSSPDEFSREDGLRGFGELIRSGKIRRKDGGMFEASDDIGFHPDELKAG